MKKTNLKSMLIGFLSCALLVMLFGFKTVEPNPIGGGKYDMISHNGELFLLDSSTSVVYVLRNNAIIDLDSMQQEMVSMSGSGHSGQMLE